MDSSPEDNIPFPSKDIEEGPTRSQMFKDEMEFSYGKDENVTVWPEQLFVKKIDPSKDIERLFFVEIPNSEQNLEQFHTLVKMKFHQPYSEENKTYFKTEQASVKSILVYGENDSWYEMYSLPDRSETRILYIPPMLRSNSNEHSFLPPIFDTTYSQSTNSAEVINIGSTSFDLAYLQMLKNGGRLSLPGINGIYSGTYDHKENCYRMSYKSANGIAQYKIPNTFSIDSLVEKAEKEGGLDPNLRYHAWDDYGEWDDTMKEVDFFHLGGFSLDFVPPKTSSDQPPEDL